MSSPGVISPEELAEDYKSSLEDLTFNSRWEITNLTVIAKENIHAAQAISRVVEQHIQKTGPARKLPAIYLLDSIAKNVGTPYTLFFSNSLYRTFMDAYSLVEPPVRRKLEEMLQTWKQPVPGSSSSTPVFPSAITSKIDTALIKARTAAVQAQQQQMKQDQVKFGIKQQNPAISAVTGANQLYRSTPTPPLPRSPFIQSAQTPLSQVLDSRESNTGTPPINLQLLQAQLAGQFAPTPPPPQSLPAPLNLESIKGDINNLILITQTRFSETPFDQDIQKRLKALLDLQQILRTQQLPLEQLSLIRDRVAILSRETINAPPPPAAPQQFPASIPNLPLSNFPFNSLIHPPVPTPQLSSFGNGAPNLAALLGALPQQSAQLSINSGVSAPNFGLPLSISTQTQPPTPIPGADLFASLMSAGLLKGPNNTIPPPPHPQALMGLAFPGIGNQSRTDSPNPSSTRNWRSIDVELTSSSLKNPKPHLLPMLNETLPNQCPSCARRFQSSEQGRKEKAAHLDWHFRVHQRLADSASRGQNRSWYVDEEDWIKSRNTSDDSLNTADNDSSNNNSYNNNNNQDNMNNSTYSGAGGGAGNSSQNVLQQQYVPVPNDPILAASTCPVCKEKFETVWHGDAEEWVWMDAVSVGDRIYHASCYSEVTKDRGSMTGTPVDGGGGVDGGSASSGKRKAEDLGELLKKMKRERV